MSAETLETTCCIAGGGPAGVMLGYLLARAGLTLSDAEKADLRAVCDGIAEMAARVRQPRGRMAEPALTYGFAEEDRGYLL